MKMWDEWTESDAHPLMYKQEIVLKVHERYAYRRNAYVQAGLNKAATYHLAHLILFHGVPPSIRQYVYGIIVALVTLRI